MGEKERRCTCTDVRTIETMEKSGGPVKGLVNSRLKRRGKVRKHIGTILGQPLGFGRVTERRMHRVCGKWRSETQQKKKEGVREQKKQ